MIKLLKPHVPSDQQRCPNPDVSFEMSFSDGAIAQADAALTLARLASAVKIIADDVDDSPGASEHQRLGAISAIASCINGIAYGLMEECDRAAKATTSGI